MPTHCIAVLLSLLGACTLPWAPLSLRVMPPPHADLCVQYLAEPPVCGSQLIALLTAAWTVHAPGTADAA